MQITLVSPCGHGNLGDASILQATIHHIYGRYPNSKIKGVTLVPADTESRHNITAFPIAALSRPEYGIILPKQSSGETDNSPDPEINHKPKFKHRLVEFFLNIIRMLLPKGWPYIIREEISHIVNGFKFIKGTNILIFSGGGQLDDFWGGAWGHPYALLKWTLIARLIRAKVVFLSVGFGSLDSRFSRIFARIALTFSHYCSYRDAGSLQLMQKSGFHRRDPVYPDLAFSYPVQVKNNLRSSREISIAISPIVYYDPRTWPKKDKKIYESYLSRLTDSIIRMIEKGYRVSLFASDGPDWRAVNEIYSSIVSRMQSGVEDYISISKTLTVDEFLKIAASVSIVIASRLHSVLLSQLAGTPVLALSYDRKVDALMHEMNHQKYCLNINDFDTDSFTESLTDMVTNIDENSRQIRAKVFDYKKLLDQQYNSILSMEKNINFRNEIHEPKTIC